MGLSETIVAAMIGGLATVSAALFQLFSALKSNERSDPRAKRGSKVRSLLSIAALMVASAIGGFLYSEFLKQRGAEQMQAMRDELREVKELAALAAGRASPPPQTRETVEAAPLAAFQPKLLEPVIDSTEALIFVPACQPAGGAGSECSESEAQRVALCGTIPVAARVTTLEMFAQPDVLKQPWEQHVAALEQDLGGARFTGQSFESAAAVDHKAVCVSFLHWNSAHSHLARLVVHYDSTALPKDPNGPARAAVAVEPTTIAPQAASMLGTGALESE